MKKITLALAVTLGLAACNKETTTVSKSTALDSHIDSVSYSMGHLFAKSTKDNMDRMGIVTDSLNQEALLEAFNAVFTGDSSRINSAEAEKVAQAFVMELQKSKQDGELSTAKAEGIAFLAQNKTKEGVVETASGLQYEVLTEGNGPKPSGPESKVTVHYHGTLINGEVFDSSVDRGETIDFPLNGVIKGWTEGVQLMNEGSKYKFYIPSDLAYGDRGPSPKIPGGSTLIFEVELIKANN